MSAVRIEKLEAVRGVSSDSVTIQWAYAPQTSEYLIRYRLNQTWYEIAFVPNTRSLTPVADSGTDFTYIVQWDADIERYVLNVTFSDALAHPNVPRVFSVTPNVVVAPRYPVTEYVFLAEPVDTTVIFGQLAGADGGFIAQGDRLVYCSYLDKNLEVELTKRSGAQSVGTAAITRRTVTFVADSSGMWQARLLRGVRVRIQIPAAAFDKVVLTPTEEGPFDVGSLTQLGDSNVPRATRKQ